jgi:N-acetylglucosaminyldiphosphoundecaprenol N-acetyl-beta-D-mannosaminyltransferase
MCRNIKQKKMELSSPQFSVLGLPVHILDDYPGWLMERLHQGLGSHVVTLNSEMAMQAEQYPALADVIRSAELVIPDGSGVVMYLRMRGKPVQRYPGIELAESLLHSSRKIAGFGTSIFFWRLPRSGGCGGENLAAKG